MSNESYNDEIDLIQIFKIFKRVFRNFVKAIISVFRFYRKKAILFLILIVLGVGLGVFIDKYKESGDEYLQDVIIEPKYNSTKYVYDFIEELEDNIGDEAFLKKLKVSPDAVENLKEVTIEPVVKGTDVLDNLQERYENKEFFKDVMTAYDEDKVEEEGFRDFYKHHKLTFSFKNKNLENSKISDAIIQYLMTNDYYVKKASLVIQQNKVSLKENKETLKLVNEYLEKLSNNPPRKEDNVVVIQNNEDTPITTIAYLFNQKETLMETIDSQERILELDKDVITIVDYGDIISIKKVLVNRTLFLIPLLLFGFTSMFYFLKYLSKSAVNFAKEED
ncbi:hypothetical protein [Aquimarina pacifica]|uniref:hypothetical protein n=1 Tax=Aquimarina pacifica TaxID=1296415 RepID=UPI00046F6451|nr:hypothetical protein [Aquimarina pacifica]